MKSDEHCIFCISIKKQKKKSLQQLNQVIIIIEENIILISDPQTFYFHFDKSKDVDKNLKHEI